MRSVMWVLLYGAACGLLLSFFTNLQDMIKYIFSLGAFFLGIHFFKRFDSIKMRVFFVITTVIMSLMFSVFYAMYVFIKQHPSGPPA